MIHQFHISNLQSIREKISIDFRVPGTSPELSCLRRSPSRPDARLPSVIALFGPNGSGKTTLLRSLVLTLGFAANSYERSGYVKSFIPFLAAEKMNYPTRIEVYIDGKWLYTDNGDSFLYRYTLEIARDVISPASPVVAYEAIHAFPRGKPRRLLERHRNHPIYIAKELGVSQRDDRLMSVPPEASAISTLGKMEVGPFPRLTQDLRNMVTNIAGSDPWRPDTDSIIRLYRDKPELVAAVSEKLQRFDLGIDGLEIIPVSDKQSGMVFRHHGLAAPVVLHAESAGARHLAHIFPLLEYVLRTGGLAIMDSLDSDFHTELALEVLNWFRSEGTNPNKAQLICSLHNPAILDHLEKEEIYIVEKDGDGVTRAYGLRDIQGLRRDVSLQKQYRGGYLGGLPVFG